MDHIESVHAYVMHVWNKPQVQRFVELVSADMNVLYEWMVDTVRRFSAQPQVLYTLLGFLVVGIVIHLILSACWNCLCGRRGVPKDPERKREAGSQGRATPRMVNRWGEQMHVGDYEIRIPTD